ncbi:hypothetical protein C6P45_003659 [Maudiozyma exigua]|uniref:C2H2-type domain-containing protein n=1 Tax=Maudiozyma exigua TaxID=34358 RepID=A0A9P6WEH9_MAUEX|nr:hypothetical protein C6P45_003659 [Kazachstania exigua]
MVYNNMEHIGQFQEGMVHGHIHNFDNMTYIHGHIHHNASHNSMDNRHTIQVQQQQEEHENTIKDENASSNVWRNPELDFTDCEHFEFMDMNNNNMFPTNFSSTIGHSFQGDGSMDLNRINTSAIHLYDNNNSNDNSYNNSSNHLGSRKSQDRRLSLSDDMLNFPLSKKRRLSNVNNAVGNSNNKDNCPCNPKLVEVCCDVDHKDTPQDDSQVENISLNPNRSFNISGENHIQSLPSYAMMPPSSNNLANDSSTNTPLQAFKKGTNQMSVDFARQFLDLNCDLTCEPECSESTDVNKVQQDTNKTDNRNVDGKEDMLETFYKACQRVGEYNETNTTQPVQKQHTHSNCNNTHDTQATMIQPQYHKHTSNKQIDMQIISDICAISSLYETPLADHMNHHHHHHHKHDEEPLSSDQPIPRSESFNLLESVVNYKGNRSGLGKAHSSDENSKLSHHHHHKIQFHDHNVNSFEPYQGDKSVSWERFKRDYKGSSNKFERKNDTVNANGDATTTIYHHNERNISDTAMKPDPLNTINFNWNFKTNDNSKGNKICCRWGDCNKEYNSLFELQRHLFNEHITEYNLPLNHSNSNGSVLPDPTNTSVPANCKWESCDFKSNDVCSFVNHVNSKHGINFDMEFIDSRDINGNTDGKINGMKNSHHMYHCKNNDCQTGSTPESSVNKDSIKSIDFTDSPSSSEIHTIKKEEQSPYVFAEPERKIAKTIQCRWEGCTEVFSSESELDHHLESFHIPRGKSSYQCHWSGCNRTLPTRQKMARHIRKHSGDKPFKCPECLKCFATKESLKQHGRIHSGERPFKCPYCDKSFASSAFVNVHIRTHTGEKPLQCPHCPKRFSESSNLNKHIKTHLKKKQQQQEQKPSTAPNVLV